MGLVLLWLLCRGAWTVTDSSWSLLHHGAGGTHWAPQDQGDKKHPKTLQQDCSELRAVGQGLPVGCFLRGGEAEVRKHMLSVNCDMHRCMTAAPPLLPVCLPW